MASWADNAMLSDPEYLINVWETDQGLPEDSATAMVQTPDGYLWFGTFNGLVRFDGVKFTVFDRSNTPELPSPGIVNLHLDQTGRLWVSTLQGIASVKDGRWRAYREDSGWRGNYVRFFAESASGDLYMTTFDEGRIFRLRDDHFEQLPSPPVDTKLGFSLHVDEAGALWVINPQFIGKFVDGKWQETISAPTLVKRDAGDFASIMGATSRDGGLWIVTHQRLLKYRAGRLVFAARAPWPMVSLWSIHEDSAGNIWICSSADGLYRFSPDGRWRHFTTGSGLSYHAARFVFEDRERNLWIGTSGGGLDRFKRRQLVNWGVAEGLPEPVAKSVAADSNGGIIIGTWGKGIVRLQGTKISEVLGAHSSKCQLFDGLVVSTLVDREGRVWAGTYANGLYRVDGDTCRGIFASQGKGPWTVGLFEDSRGRVWVGTDEGAINFDGNQTKKYPLEGAPPHSIVRTFAEGPRSGTLWAGNEAGGLYRLQGERFVPVPEAQELANQQISTLLADKDGTLWIGTEDGGIAVLRHGRLIRISEKQGLPTRTITSILDDDLGNLWFGSNRGILRAQRDQLEALIARRERELTFQVFNQSDGMASVESSMHSQPSSVRGRDGKLWFATFRGVVMLDPKTLSLNRQPPPLAIQKVLIDDRPAGSQEQFITSRSPAPISVTVPPGPHRLEIHYSGLSFTAPEKVRFRYMLEGLDKDWIDVGDRRVAYLQGLKPGHYRFRVKAVNNDGVWNEMGTFAQLHIEPHYYQTYWFYALCSFAVLLSGVGLHRLRTRQLWVREQQLLRVVEDRTQELRQYKDHLEEQVAERTADLMSSEEKLRQAQKMEAIGRLAGGVAHDFNNLLNVIAGYTELMLYQLPPDSLFHGYAENIRKASEKAAGLTRQLLAFGRKQVVARRVLDLNILLRETGELLPRLIGEDIEIAVRTPPEEARVRVDPIQMQQIILNLAVNARDAMPTGGEFIIETRCVDLNDEISAQQFPCPPGRYVLLSVSDTGVGIPLELQAHIFEPFFTTKEQGKGTGLGLATVYGIVQQTGGGISVYSEPGLGTTFKIYFPRVEEAAEPVPVPAGPQESLHGTETILLVEDQKQLRTLMSVFLERQGYTVIQASRPSEALELARQQKQQIDLLLTDVVMPGMHGPQLAEQILAFYPRIKTLFVSGYAPENIGVQLEADFAFLEKPIGLHTLARKLREVLTTNASTSSVN